ncbi:hypothetical protein BJ994_001987 [Arthrobacter pigmenti]|uniref:Uncharacterized protein n=1 Tax=Arthrobacter pigmenti TaxID=271432 RepID=A0A846RXH4_9MICC|nr:hypothetical protein [Arthrobacter pigmenti]NJC22911.1 hypothetical protein [Arthrobacter pigmenti]
MDIQNHYYGHSSVLAAYCSMPRLRHVSGLIQHGWTVTSPIIAQFGDFADKGPGRRRLSWTSRSRAFSPTDSENLLPDGSQQLHAIGAPFLYLLEMARASHTLPLDRQGTLVFPMHGTALLKVSGNHAGYAEEVLQREGPSTVCLHVDDLDDPSVAGVWTKHGHTVVSAGDRRDPRFLGRILSLVASSNRVVSNRLSTSIMYASVAGADVELYGPEFQLGHNLDVDPGKVMERLWPEFHSAEADQSVLRAIAGDELGFTDMRSPEELMELLGWNRTSAGPFLEYWLSGPFDKARAVLGLKKRPNGAHITEVGLSPWHWLRHPLKHLPSPLPRLVSEELLPSGAIRQNAN